MTYYYYPFQENNATTALQLAPVTITDRATQPHPIRGQAAVLLVEGSLHMVRNLCPLSILRGYAP